MIPCQGVLSRALLKGVSKRTYSKYLNALKSPVLAQDKLLQSITSELSQTAYGVSFGVSAHMDYQAFKQTVPIVDYEALSPWIKQSKNRCKILTTQKIQFYEKTSGSTSAQKHIPYTKGLISTFGRMFKIWSYDCLSHGLKLSSGKIFISISPVATGVKSDQSVIETDQDYLQGALKWLVSPFVVSHPALKDIHQPDLFKCLLALRLLAESELEVISVWSPSYLLVLLSYIEQHWEALIELLKQRVFTLDKKQIKMRISAKRLEYLKTFATPSSWEKIWPNLKMISCWDCAAAFYSANRLKQMFPDVFVQGKGLLATEGPITVPIIQAQAHMPLVEDVFMEFEDSQGNIYLLDELSPEQTYNLIISQRGGLYRYRLNDKVVVDKVYLNTPGLKFVGRVDDCCDMVGEKLNEHFVRDCLMDTFKDTSQSLVLLPFMLETGQGQYNLLTNQHISKLQQKRLERALCKSFHYQVAIKNHQLLPMKVIFHPYAPSLLSKILSQEGIKWGDQKECHLMTSIERAGRVIEQLTQVTMQETA